MARKCELTGKRPLSGNKVSHSNIKTRTRWMPNMKSKKYFIPELGMTTSFYLSAGAIKTIDKQGGISNAIMKSKNENISENMMIFKNRLIKKTRKTSEAKTK